MNLELLKKLQLEAGGSHYPDINPDLQAKFAELIVAECVEQILTGVRTNPPQPQPPELVQTLVRRIQRHFGVAE
jgi:hypothetical protein